jgi:hypothetical protein
VMPKANNAAAFLPITLIDLIVCLLFEMSLGSGDI